MIGRAETDAHGLLVDILLRKTGRADIAIPEQQLVVELAIGIHLDHAQLHADESGKQPGQLIFQAILALRALIPGGSRVAAEHAQLATLLDLLQLIQRLLGEQRNGDQQRKQQQCNQQAAGNVDPVSAGRKFDHGEYL